MLRVGSVARDDDGGRQTQAAQLLEPAERARARHRGKRVSQRVQVSVLAEALAGHGEHRARELGVAGRGAEGLEEALDPTVAQPLGEPIPALQAALLQGIVTAVGWGDDDDPRDPLGASEREVQQRVGPARAVATP
jgi:hypothetical protein